MKAHEIATFRVDFLPAERLWEMVISTMASTERGGGI